MTLAAALGDLTPRRSGTSCFTCMCLARLDAVDAETLRRLLNVPKGDPARISSQAISDTLRDHGHDEVSEQSVSKHRRSRHV